MSPQVRTGARSVVSAVVLALAWMCVVGAGPAAAAPDATPTVVDLSVLTCVTGASPELCTPPATTTVTTDGTLRVDFTASSAHCSSMIAHVFVDGTEKYASQPLAAGASTGSQDLGPVSAGTHTIGVEGEGVVGGCNAGTIASWAGTLTVETASAGGAGGPPWWVVLLVLAILAAVGAAALLRRRGGAAPGAAGTRD